MKNIVTIIVIGLSFNAVFAQQPANQTRISLKDKKDKLVQIVSVDASLYVEGYDGDEVIIEPYNLPISKNIPAEATGLKNITALTAQTIPARAEKIIPTIRELPQVIYITMPFPNYYKAILVKVPKATHLKLQYATKLFDNSVSLKNLSGELEVSGNTALTEINNISGPLTLHSNSLSHSKIKISNITWDNISTDKAKFLLYLSSSADDFDIALPGDMKATFNINSDNGDIYSDLNMVPKFPESNSLNYFKGDLNGGGVIINIISANGNIFIRKQK